MAPSASVSHLVHVIFDGRQYAGAWAIAGDRVQVWSRYGRMSARAGGEAHQTARGLLEVIVLMHLSAQMAGGQ